MKNVLDQLNSQKVVSERKTKTVVEIEFVEDNSGDSLMTSSDVTQQQQQHVIDVQVSTPSATQAAMMTSQSQGTNASLLQEDYMYVHACIVRKSDLIRVKIVTVHHYSR